MRYYQHDCIDGFLLLHKQQPLVMDPGIVHMPEVIIKGYSVTRFLHPILSASLFTG